MKANRKKIGIFGGSFNPIHLGHLIISEYFKEAVGLEKLLIIPTAVSPFKADNLEKQPAASDRLAMLKLAYNDNPNIKIIDFEILKGGVSYTFETLRYLRSQMPNAEFYLMVGEDQALKFDKWMKANEIATNARICVACRDTNSGVQDKIKEIFENNFPETEPIFLQSPLLEISSSDIRKRCSERRSIKYLVPDSVRDYILRRSLYPPKI